MDSGYYAACAGFAAQSQALELIGHNLANLGTSGYLGEQATFRSLVAGSGWVALNPVNVAVNDYGVLSGSRIDQAPANLTSTGNPLDVGIGGKGFFAVQVGDQTLFTRDGSFHATAQGQLVTAEGNAVLAEAPQGVQLPITIPTGAVAISPDGTISVEGAVVAKLRIAEFEPGTSLTAVGNSLYSAPQNSEQPATSSSVEQGMLNNSNVTAVASVVQLITVQRNAEMLQRAITMFDSQMNQTAAQDIPRV